MESVKSFGYGRHVQCYGPSPGALIQYKFFFYIKEKNKRQMSFHTAVEDLKDLNKVVKILKTEISAIKGNDAS